jgi:hypothetical protein
MKSSINTVSIAGHLRCRPDGLFYLKYLGSHCAPDGSIVWTHTMTIKLVPSPELPAVLSGRSSGDSVVVHGYLGPSGILYVTALTGN